MTEKIVSLAYKSRSVADEVDEATLGLILRNAQDRNVKNNLTGALAYGDGHFIQVLEGPEQPLLIVMDSIRADVRHHSLEITGPTPVSTRSFPDWCMASVAVEEDLRLIFSQLVADWHSLSGRAADILAAALEE